MKVQIEPGAAHIRLEHQWERDEIRALRDKAGDDACMPWIYEAGGFDRVRPESIAALTSQPLFADADAIRYHEDGRLAAVYGPIYGFPDYTVASCIDPLVAGRWVRFPEVVEG